jgi:hypothetical protein
VSLKLGSILTHSTPIGNIVITSHSFVGSSGVFGDGKNVVVVVVIGKNVVVVVVSARQTPSTHPPSSVVLVGNLVAPLKLLISFVQKL